MKRLLFAVFSLCLVTACGGSAISIMSPEELAMVGDWKLKRTEFVNAQDSVFMVQDHSNFTSCHLYLTGDSSLQEGFYDANVGLTCLPQALEWKLSSDSVLQLGTSWLLDIKLVDSDSLVLRYGYPAYTIYYLSKT